MQKALAVSKPASKIQPSTKRRAPLPSFMANPGAYGLKEDTVAVKAMRTRELKHKTPKIEKPVFHEYHDEKLVEQLGPIPGFEIECEPYLVPPPEIRLVDPTTLYIDRNYQRVLSPLDLRLLQDITVKFSWAEFKVPNAFEDEDGRLFLTDGQKSALGAIYRKIPLIPIVVTKAPQEESLRQQATAFVGINSRRKAIPAQEMFTALLVTGDESERALANILRANNIQPVANRGSTTENNYTVGQTQSITILRALHKQHGDANFDVMCRMMAAARFRPIKREHIHAMGAIVDTMDADKIDIDRMANAIRSIVDRHALLEAREASRKSNRHVSVGKALADIYLTGYRRKAKALDHHE